MVWSFLRSLFLRRELLLDLTRRELTDRYAGQVVGPLWTIVHPLVLVSVYIFVFVVVFRARIDLPNVPSNYVAYILSGLLPWFAAVDALARSAVAISGNAALVKQIVFPTELLVGRAVIAALFTQVLATLLFFLYFVVAEGYLPAGFLLAPVLIVLEGTFLLGLGLMTAAIGAFFRDTKDIVQVAGVVGVYLAPIIYLPHWLPEPALWLISLNPFSHLVWVFQDAFFFDAIDHPVSWAVVAILAAASLVAGLSLFQRLKATFSSVL